MQRLEVSGAVRPIYGSLGVKRLRVLQETYLNDHRLFKEVKLLQTSFWNEK